MTSQALNRPVDVLAVMQSAKDRCDCRPGVDHCTPCREMGVASAAVAELIAADREYDAAKEDLATQRRQVGAIAPATARFQRAEKRRAAALDAIGSAK